MAGIGTMQWSYEQMGIVATLQLADNVRLNVLDLSAVFRGTVSDA